MQHIVGGVRVFVLVLIAHDHVDLLATILEYNVISSRMVLQERCHVVDLALVRKPAAGRCTVSSNVLGSENFYPFRHGCDKDDVDDDDRRKVTSIHLPF